MSALASRRTRLRIGLAMNRVTGSSPATIPPARPPWPHAVIDQSVLDRAFDVQGELASHGLHRTVKIGDLIIAAAAERGGLVVLHYDRDFDRIGDVTHQPMEWVVPAVPEVR
jgi:hypothetical protein